MSPHPYRFLSLPGRFGPISAPLLPASFHCPTPQPHGHSQSHSTQLRPDSRSSTSTRRPKLAVGCSSLVVTLPTLSQLPPRFRQHAPPRPSMASPAMSRVRGPSNAVLKAVNDESSNVQISYSGAQKSKSTRLTLSGLTSHLV
ncbi:hypothetical protein CGCA056_v012111 [Colletotrichum aenigma]|uniref:uncharacterized protein n=1 Tax=Colletotrichum aenigma TaxID=1215731 RepID=UPI00187298EA|nr:uncharacterized protein CGCA056_v012111 [Colletotrichum aenigma]KAF5513010.1 hypothetical protein CGCA056_v012111 [Colletotrichum aenigma]